MAAFTFTQGDPVQEGGVSGQPQRLPAGPPGPYREELNSCRSDVDEFPVLGMSTRFQSIYLTIKVALRVREESSQ